MIKRIKSGQIWKYKTRVNESDSRVTILSIDKENHITHVELNGLKLLDNSKNEIFAISIGHLPIATDVFLSSITEFECISIVELNEGYNHWKLEFQKGNAGVWSINLSDAIDIIEKTHNQNE